MTKPIPLQTALIIGAGAVENAWQPIIDTLQPNFKYEMDGDAAYCALARIIYLIRFYSTGDFKGASENAAATLKNYNDLKNGMARNLCAAQSAGTIRARKELPAILKKYIFSAINKTVLISTNWDTVIEHEINSLAESNYPLPGSKVNAIHIHGSVDKPESMYMPSEIVRETYRSKAEDEKMGHIHGSVWQHIEDCDITILYGLSLDPLDAELSQTLIAGWASPRIKEIVIIDPNHAKVANRVKFLTDERYPVKITGYQPWDLVNSTNYS